MIIYDERRCPRMGNKTATDLYSLARCSPESSRSEISATSDPSLAHLLHSNRNGGAQQNELHFPVIKLLFLNLKRQDSGAGRLHCTLLLLMNF